MKKEERDPFDLESGVPKAAPVTGELVPKPKVSIGMNKGVLGGLFVLGAVLLVLLMVAIDRVEETPNTVAAPAAKEDKPQDDFAGQIPTDFRSSKKGAVSPPAESATSTESAPGSDLPSTPIAGAKPSTPESPSTAGGNSVLGSTAKPASGANPNQVPPIGTANSAISPEAQRELVAKQKRDDRLAAARLDGLEVKGYQDAGAGSSASALPRGEAARNEMAAKNAAALAAAGVGMPRSGSLGGSSSGSGNEQDEKLKFIKDGGNATDGYHKSTLVPPASPYQLNAGAFIPSVLEMAVNSDLPGQTTAKVRENVYASVNENCLLIPSGAQLVGNYDSKVAVGQNRQLVVWNRVLYPNGYELNLGGMTTADLEGQSGLAADVDNHWMRLFGVALGMTAVTAGVQMAVNVPGTTATGGSSTPTAAQSISQALTQQFGQLGGQIMGRYLNIQPTLRNFVGERFNIAVPRSIVFPRCYRG